MSLIALDMATRRDDAQGSCHEYKPCPARVPRSPHSEFRLTSGGCSTSTCGTQVRSTRTSSMHECLPSRKHAVRAPTGRAAHCQWNHVEATIGDEYTGSA